MVKNKRAYFRQYLVTLIDRSKKSIARSEDSLRELSGLDFDDAQYIINLSSLWSKEGEEDVTKNYRGKLETAIEKAEEEFKEKNNRSDIQARYEVQIKIGNVFYQMPEEFWSDYQERNRKKG